MRALILAAGGGNNMAPFSVSRPKPMLHVAGRPILDYTLEMLRESGCTDVNMVRGPFGDSIHEHYGTGAKTGLNINYIHQAKADGIGKAVLLAQESFNPGDHFLLVYSDIVTDDNILANVLQAFHFSHLPTAGIVLPAETGSFGNVYLDKDVRITKIVEKPKRKDLGNYVLAGVFVLPYSFFDLLRKAGGDMMKAFAALIKKEGMKASIWEQGWIDIGYPWDILTANRVIMDTWQTSMVHRNINVKDAKIKGPVHIEEGVEIRSGAIIEGPAFIGRGSYIGNNVLVRKYSSIGPESIVGFGVELKNCVIFGKASGGRLSYIGDSVIGMNVDIGSGTMTINQNIDRSEIAVRFNGRKIKTGMDKLGAFIGDGTVLGGGHSIRAGSVIDAGLTVPHHHTFPPKGR
jgi:bifunctional UDP-N-acetylglucosamine pyrophosphorylase/glucosamine-1-phosphate N-acetyltransferase